MIVVKAPLRISFFGGGADWPDHFNKHPAVWINAAINKYVYCVAHQRVDGKIYVGYSRQEIVDTPEEISHELVNGAYRVCEDLLDPDLFGLELKYMADIPERGGSGLGSSSAFTAATIMALSRFCPDKTIGKERLAQLTCSVERDICGAPIGVQDQFACVYGGLRRWDADSEGVRSEKYPSWLAREFEKRFVLFDLDMERDHNPLVEQESLIKSGVSTKTLLEMSRNAMKADSYIQRRHWIHAGNILEQLWQSKKKLAGGISSSRIDKVVTEVVRHGALGCKVCGAGGGGHLLCMVMPSDREHLVERMNGKEGLMEVPFQIDDWGTRVIFEG